MERLGGRLIRRSRRSSRSKAAAGPVRDADVQLLLLEDLLKARGAATSVAERNDISEEADKLQAKLEKRREDAAAELGAVIVKLEDKEIRRISPLQSDLIDVKWTSLLKDARAVERRSAQGFGCR